MHISKSNKSNLNKGNIEKHIAIITQNLCKIYIEKSRDMTNLANSEILCKYIFPITKFFRNSLALWQWTMLTGMFS